jgi:hypothetical protein
MHSTLQAGKGEAKMKVNIVHLTYRDMQKKILDIINKNCPEINEWDLLDVEHYLNEFVAVCESKLTDAESGK